MTRGRRIPASRLTRLWVLWFVWVVVALVRLAGQGCVSLDPVEFGGGAVRIDLNRAPVDVLALLPGIGPTRARSIVLYRVRFGPFRAISDLSAVDGIGEATVAGLRAQVFAEAEGDQRRPPG